MEELLLCSGMKRAGRILLDVDFSKQQVGDTFITDHSGENQFSLLKGSLASVITDPEMGKVMQMSNSVYTTPPDVIFDLTTIDFDLVIVSKLNPGGPARQVAFQTGDFTSGRIPGFSVSLNFDGGYRHLFLDTGSSYWRLYCSKLDNVWSTLTYKFRLKSQNQISVTESTTGDTQVIKGVTFGKGQRFAIGGSYPGNELTPMIGLLKSVKITEVV